MKIRTITTGFTIDESFSEKKFLDIADTTHNIKEMFQNKSYDVQTIRMSTQPWEQFASTESELIEQAEEINHWAKTCDIDYFNLGPTKDASKIPWLIPIIQNTDNGFCTVHICDSKNIFYDTAWETAKLMKQLSTIEPNGFANLRFAALCNIKAETPFYPASYHSGRKPSFGIGLENSDILYSAFEKAGSVTKAKQHLKKIFERIYTDMEKNSLEISEKTNMPYCGSDVSISSSVQPNESIAYGFEHLGLGTFGEPGTLSIAKLVTATVQELPVKKTGYCGLMLPVLEDHGLATRNTEGHLSIMKLLLYSSVCGTGLDTIPLPGDISVETIYGILLDVAALSIKLQKPLSARLMPIPGKKAGEKTTFNFPYFVNSAIMKP
jgi:uncharacterized protein